MTRLAQLTARFFRRTRPHDGGRHRTPEVTPRPLSADQITAAVESLTQEPTALERAVQRHLEGETRVMGRAARQHALDRDRGELVRRYVTERHMQGWS